MARATKQARADDVGGLAEFIIVMNERSQLLLLLRQMCRCAPSSHQHCLYLLQSIYLHFTVIVVLIIVIILRFINF